MGYRSDVAISTTEEGYERLVAMCDEAGVEHPLVSSTVEPDFIERFEGSVVFGWNEIKWYEDLPDVGAVSKAVRALLEDDVPMAFVRVGEDPEDIERWGKVDGLTAYPVPYVQRAGIETVYA